ncbi:MAG TPA: class I SAM-dependent methyltransferase [Candidatus Sulfotelmatobacter sp.]|nr:class I SAM-dependent methyltransferase [Candidatus Sulfotelmatobacter sp.]
MSVTPQHALAAPFDAIASRYDQAFTSSRIGQAQRAAVWRVLEKVFRPGDRILEIGCGTGVDACFLAQRGVRVVACDASSQMIEVAARRIQHLGLNDLVRPAVLRAEDLSTLPPDAPFDGAFSNFGALNCVEDLEAIARPLAKLLKPGASALLCWMGPYCLWEMIWYLAHSNTAKAFRRFHCNGVSARIADGPPVQVYYPSVRMLARKFSPELQLKSIRGIGLAVPPSYVEPWFARHPALLNSCHQLDIVLGRCPGIRALGDHVLVRFQRAETCSMETGQ